MEFTRDLKFCVNGYNQKMFFLFILDETIRCLAGRRTRDSLIVLEGQVQVGKTEKERFVYQKDH